VINELRRVFSHPQLQIHDLSAHKSHVAVGAVHTRFNSDFIVRRPQFQSVGIVTWRELTPAIKRMMKRLKLSYVIDEGLEGMEYFLCVEWIVKGVSMARSRLMTDN